MSYYYTNSTTHQRVSLNEVVSFFCSEMNYPSECTSLATSTLAAVGLVSYNKNTSIVTEQSFNEYATTQDWTYKQREVFGLCLWKKYIFHLY